MMQLKKKDMALQIITSNEKFEPYREDWSKILEAKQNTNPFIEFDWINEWWRHLGADQSVEIIAVSKDEEIIAFFPFLYTKKNFVYTYSFIGYGQANYMDVVALESNLAEAMEYVIEFIIKKRKHVVFYLHGLLESEQTLHVLKDYLETKQHQFSYHRVVTPFIHLDAIKLEKYMKKRRRLHRLDRREKRLCENANIKIKKCPPEEIDYIFHLHNQRWQKKHDTSGFTNPKERAFYKKLAAIKTSPMKAEVDALYLNNKMIAFNYGFNCRGRFLGYVLGYDDDFEVFSPGRLLEKEKIIQCKNGSDKIFDLSIGYESYKFDWNTGVDYTERVVFSSFTPLAITARNLISAKEKLIENIKKNHQIVLFKRNQLGKLLFKMNNLVEKGFKGTLTESRRGFNTIRNKLYNHQKFVVYKIDNKKIPDAEENIEFVELTLDTAVQNEEIANKYMKIICRKIYGGYKGYYPKGNLSFNNILWTNDRVLRIDQIAYLEQFKKSSIAVNNWANYELSDVCATIKNRSNARLMYVAIDEKADQKKTALESLGFMPIKHISKKTVFGFGRYSITN